MSKISKELIENYRKIILPYVSNQLYKANFEGQGETDKTEFEQDFNKILDLAIKALEGRPQGEWIRYRDEPHQPEHIKCSNCGQYWSIADHDKTFDFCFKCGADMRGGAEKC